MHPLQDDSNGGGSIFEDSSRRPSSKVYVQASAPMDRFHAQLLMKVEGNQDEKSAKQESHR